MAKEFFLPYIKKEQVAKDTFSFYFDRTQVDYDFLPGQYNRVTIPHDNADDRGTSRYFTIASSPYERERLMITTKLIKSTFKESLHRLISGQPVRFFGPMGWFLLPKDEAEEKVFIAGGIGVTPFHSLLLSLQDKKLRSPITVFVSFSNYEDVIFYDILNGIAQNNSAIRVIYTVSKPSAGWRGETGRVSGELLKKYINDLSKPKYYLVGSDNTVDGIKKILVNQSINEEKIFTESFTGYDI